MTRQVHLVGSVPLESAEAVMATCCSTLGKKIARIPDGETGNRSNWIHWQRDILGSHPGIHLVGQGRNAKTTMPKFAVKDGFSGELAFPNLGYLASAVESYATFTQLRKHGKIGDQRFQVCLPTPLAAIACYVHERSQERVFAPYKDCLLAETRKIIEAIPAQDLAIQWDVAIEFAVLEGLFPVWFDEPFRKISDQLVELTDLVPSTAEVGFHFCYGDSGNKHFKEPEDMGLLVKLANQLCRNAERGIDWIHMPVPIDREDADYFRPLRELDRDNLKQLYLGLLHEQDGIEGANKRMAAANAFATDYGLATECGLGRREPDIIQDLLELHASI